MPIIEAGFINDDSKPDSNALVRFGPTIQVFAGHLKSVSSSNSITDEFVHALIDERVAYARQLHEQSDLRGGSFDTRFSFGQALTEAAKAADNCLLVISLPASDTASHHIEAKIPSGAPDYVVRAVTENSNTLKFRSHGFEED